jgi:hypothetical protein
MSEEKPFICSKCNIEKLDNDTEGFVEIKPDDETPKTHCCESITPALVEEKKEETTSIPKHHQEIRCGVCDDHLGSKPLSVYCECCGVALANCCRHGPCYMRTVYAHFKVCPSDIHGILMKMFVKDVMFFGVMICVTVWLVSNVCHRFGMTHTELAIQPDVLIPVAPISSRFSLEHNEYEILGWCDQRNDNMCIKTVQNTDIYNIYVMESSKNELETYVINGKFKKGDILRNRVWLLHPDDVKNRRSEESVSIHRICRPQDCKRDTEWK